MIGAYLVFLIQYLKTSNLFKFNGTGISLLILIVQELSVNNNTFSMG